MSILFTEMGSNGDERKQLVSWVKKVSKIFRTLLALERQKMTLPLMSPSLESLIIFMRKGAFLSLIE